MAIKCKIFFQQLISKHAMLTLIIDFINISFLYNKQIRLTILIILQLSLYKLCSSLFRACSNLYDFVVKNIYYYGYLLKIIVSQTLL